MEKTASSLESIELVEWLENDRQIVHQLEHLFEVLAIQDPSVRRDFMKAFMERSLYVPSFFVRLFEPFDIPVLNLKRQTFIRLADDQVGKWQRHFDPLGEEKETASQKERRVNLTVYHMLFETFRLLLAMDPELLLDAQLQPEPAVWSIVQRYREYLRREKDETPTTPERVSSTRIPMPPPFHVLVVKPGDVLYWKPGESKLRIQVKCQIFGSPERGMTLPTVLPVSSEDGFVSETDFQDAADALLRRSGCHSPGEIEACGEMRRIVVQAVREKVSQVG